MENPVLSDGKFLTVSTSVGWVGTDMVPSELVAVCHGGHALHVKCGACAQRCCGRAGSEGVSAALASVVNKTVPFLD